MGELITDSNGEICELMKLVYAKLTRDADDPRLSLRHLVLQAKFLDHLRQRLLLNETR